MFEFHIDSPQNPLVLGHPWLRIHTPSIDWATGKITALSTLCLSNCLRSASAPAAVPPQSVPEPRDLSAVPRFYYELGVLFDKQCALSLPLHRHIAPHDCTIALLPAAPLPSSPPFNLSWPEQRAMEGYIQDSLVAGVFRPSSSSVGAGFFVAKKDKTLHPSIDFCKLNDITVKM